MIPITTAQFACFNGPCEGSTVHAPTDATPGTACALPWRTIKGASRFAVYILVDYNGTQGLMYLQSYEKPDYAARKVKRLTLVCAGNVS